MTEGDCVPDIGKGTGSLLPCLRDKTGVDGLVVGADFSTGMLKVGQEKIKIYENTYVRACDVAYLPFNANVFDAVTCTHAFYESKGDTQDRVTKEPRLVSNPVIVSHEIPR